MKKILLTLSLCLLTSVSFAGIKETITQQKIHFAGHTYQLTGYSIDKEILSNTYYFIPAGKEGETNHYKSITVTTLNVKNHDDLYDSISTVVYAKIAKLDPIVTLDIH